MIVHSAFCPGETALDIEAVLKQAVLKRGLPVKLVIDNGPATLQAVCAHLGIPHAAQVIGVEDDNGASLGAATLLDAVANTHRRRRKPQPGEPPQAEKALKRFVDTYEAKYPECAQRSAVEKSGASPIWRRSSRE